MADKRTWGRRPYEPVLSGMSLTFWPGELVAVTGAVGSGKSTLLAAIAGAPHVAVLRGHVLAAAAAGGDTPPVISLAAQQPWLFSGTLRDNVVCGQPFDADRYAAVLEACELGRDVAELGPAGDSTLVGEQGVMLSGGQRARVALARCAYLQQAEVYLFDDSLAALDVHVGARVFQKLLCDLLQVRRSAQHTHCNRVPSRRGVHLEAIRIAPAAPGGAPDWECGHDCQPCTPPGASRASADGDASWIWWCAAG
jgi:ABC-type multidrug transport system fused ATPase/permease subunit